MNETVVCTKVPFLLAQRFDIMVEHTNRSSVLRSLIQAYVNDPTILDQPETVKRQNRRR